uniref:Uncharacterized protein n=1 Tax=Globisporangium ultimum (strain ATCC 200006 / CBS 805.95 / DAOM BR144) TaxID=431595 RepID=K3WS67_GLOUD
MVATKILNAVFTVAFALQSTASLANAASATEQGVLSSSWLMTSSHQLHEPAESSESVYFFVCDSKINGMDGKYVLQDEPDGVQSDANTPAFVREDNDNGDNFAMTSTTSERDFRLFRHNGFWMFADIAPWPPVTHFRCDPTKRNAQIPKNANLFEVCSVDLASPPRIGYSPANPHHGVHHLMLQLDECSGNSEVVALEVTQDVNDSKRASRMAEL